jgi:hypothetical protein
MGRVFGAFRAQHERKLSARLEHSVAVDAAERCRRASLAHLMAAPFGQERSRASADIDFQFQRH